MSVGRVRAVAEKELRSILRDPRSLGVTLVLPMVLLVLFGYAINFDVRHISLAVCDPKPTATSRDLLESLTATESFDIVAHLASPNEADELLARGRAQVVLVLPTRFTEDLAAGQAVRVQTIINGSDSLTATVALGYLDGLIADWARKWAAREAPRQTRRPAIEPKVRIWFNEDLSSVKFIAPGLVVVILMLLAALLTSQSIVREREQGTMEGLVVSPVTERELLAGKLLPYVGIALADVALVAVAASVLFKVPLRGSPFVMLGLLFVYLLAALGLGLFISVVAKSQQTAYLVALIGTLLPTMLLTGFIFPIASMPKVLQAAVQLHPATHFMSIARALSLRGAEFTELWPRSLALAALTAGIMGATIARFRKTL
jgi:ABC-2 type transport system permease protein